MFSCLLYLCNIKSSTYKSFPIKTSRARRHFVCIWLKRFLIFVHLCMKGTKFLTTFKNRVDLIILQIFLNLNHLIGPTRQNSQKYIVGWVGMVVPCTKILERERNSRSFGMQQRLYQSTLQRLLQYNFDAWSDDRLDCYSKNSHGLHHEFPLLRVPVVL